MRFIVRLLAIVGLLSILLVAAMIAIVVRSSVLGAPAAPIKDGTVLTLTVDGPFLEESPTRTGLTGVLTGHTRKLREVLDGIATAAKDSRIKGLILKIDASPGMAQSQELRVAIKRFREAGKFTYAFADDFGEGGPGNGEYYLAAACDQIWLQPLGQTMLTDVAFEEPFLKGALAKLDVDPEFVKRGQYKTAPETFAESGFTSPAREMMESLANDLTLQLVTDIAGSRALSPDEVRALFSRGPLATEDAVKAKLIDHIGYADEVVAAAKKAAGANGRTLPLTDYASRVGENGGAANIALIYEVGEIDRVGGSIDDNARVGRDTGGAVMQGFAKAMAADSVKAIVLRVDSPGGSVSGSEAIRRMLVLAKAAGKKVVVSMGATAASGGYWISVDADKIVADPATLTGSIGVFSGKFAVGKGLADIGVTTDRTAAGPFAGMDSAFTPFTPDQLQKLNANVETIYEGFVQRVADGRRMPAGTIAQSAQGRVWTGQQAKQLGLIDSLGGLEEAIGVAREVAGIPADEATVVHVYPEPLTPIETLRAVFAGDGGVETELNAEIDAALSAMRGPAGLVARAFAPLFREPRDEGARMPALGPVN